YGEGAPEGEMRDLRRGRRHREGRAARGDARQGRRPQYGAADLDRRDACGRMRRSHVPGAQRQARSSPGREPRGMTTSLDEKSVRVALVQMCSGREVARNVRDASALIREAAAGGAAYIQTPEVTNLME